MTEGSRDFPRNSFDSLFKALSQNGNEEGNSSSSSGNARTEEMVGTEMTCALSPASEDCSHDPGSNPRSLTVKYCEVCGAENARCCTNCRQVSYCGKDHQFKHWKAHKLNCFPVKVMDRSVLYAQGKDFQGRHPDHVLVSTRDIKAGEVFFREGVILASPGPWDPEGIDIANGRPICVSCCEMINSSCEYEDDDEDCTTRCSHCQWPVCNSFCETDKRHSDYECKVLSSGRVSTMVLNQMPDYECILVLRALLLKERNPEKWMRLMNLEAPVTTCMDNEISSNYLNSAVKFIRETCGLKQYSDRLIRQVASICFLYAMHNDDHPGDNGYIYKIASYIGDISSKVAHSCIANSEWAVIPTEEDEFRFRALVAIKAGELITTVYSYKSVCHQGSRSRQNFLSDHYFFSCKCKRCKDPTELGTFFSAIKCSSYDCNGKLLPVDPCAPNSEWACDSGTCSSVRPQFWVEELMNEVKSELLAYPYTDPMRVSRKNNDTKKRLWGLKRLVDKFRTTHLHPNHYLLLAAEWKIIENCYHIIMSVKRFSPDVVRFVATIGKKHLELYDKVSPGMSRRRGFIFYYSQAGLLESLRHETTKLTKNQRKRMAIDDPEKLADLKKTYFEVVKMRKESSKIFSFKGVVHNSVEEELVNFSALDQPFMFCLKFLERFAGRNEEDKELE